MKFTITPQRTALGTDVTVGIEAEDTEDMVRVYMECDGLSVSDETLNPPEVSYQQQLASVAGYTPGNSHVVRVTVSDSKGSQKVASIRWTDR
jgi:hypothetical protein